MLPILLVLVTMKVWALVFLFAVACAKHEVYQGWKSYYVQPSSQEQQKAVGGMVDEYHLDFLSIATIDRAGLVLVQPKYQEGFIKALEEHEISYTVHSEDVKAALDDEDVLFTKRREESRIKNGGRNLPLNYYLEWEEIDAYIQDIARRFPNIVTLVTPANSFEGRPIRYLRISTTNFQDTSKPVIFIDGGIHAREWISPPTVLWAIHMLVEGGADADLLNNFDWIILPVVNPDGYKFTFTNSRFWRKTRSTDPSNPVTFGCPGVDGNRNYDFFWNTVGTSPLPCADTYAGRIPFSEVETRVVRDIINEYLPRMPLYLTMHSYGSMILYPWGHDGSFSNYVFQLHGVGVGMADAMHSLAHPSFPRYLVGNSVQVIGYPAAGASEDYAHQQGVPLSYTYELPGLAGGLNGFHLDPIWIEQVCRETWAGIAVGARRARELFFSK